MKTRILCLALVLCLATALAAPASAEAVSLAPGSVVQLAPGDTLDMDGDGTEETIDFGFGGDEAESLTKYELSVNGQQLVSGEGGMFEGTVWALKLLGGRQDVLVMVYDLGPSDDSELLCFAMVNGKLTPVGSIFSRPQDLQLSPGLITGMVRGAILQTWYRPGDYAISHDWTYDEASGEPNDKPRIVEVPRAVYPMGTQVTLGADLKLLVSPVKGAETAITAKKGERVILTASDDIRWVYITTTQDLSEIEGNYYAGWFDIGLNNWEGIKVGSKTMPAADLFQGLLFAD